MTTVRLYAQCHCRRQTFHFDVQKKDLPLENWTCHCDDCRHLTGLLYGDFAMLPKTVAVPFDENNLPPGLSMYTREHFSIKWYFCSHCGAHVVQSDSKGGLKGRFDMSLGTMYPLHLDDGTVVTRRTRHLYVKHGRDLGGLTRMLPDNVPRYIDRGNTLADDATMPTKEEEEAIKKAIEAPTLPLRCHCGHVQLQVHRPSSKPVAERWKVAVKNDAWVWNSCLCHSCRTTSGFDISSFLFAPYSHITGPPGSKHPTDGLSVYASFEGRRRFFCPTCGACVFFDRADRGGDEGLADVFLGLVDVPLAALFNSWTWQSSKPSFWEFAKNKEIAELLRQGICPDQDLNVSPADVEDSAQYKGTLQL